MQRKWTVTENFVSKYAILNSYSTNYNIKSLGHYKSQIRKFKSWQKTYVFFKDQQLAQRQHFFVNILQS
jgi:hypothetical protein